jgi:transcriptional regulator with GAF, ATPase, and Fis domain
VNPRLIVISGILKGTIFALSDCETAIGRDGSNSLCLNDPSVSRNHCLIRFQSLEPQDTGEDSTLKPGDLPNETDGPHQGQPSLTIVDLESFNGTFVNGLPIKEQVLYHGDQIAVGDVVVLFLLDEIEEGFGPPTSSDEAEVITRSTVRLRAEDALYLRPERVLAQLPANERIARDLNALLKISTKLNRISDISELQSELLTLIVEVIPTERAAVLLVGETDDPFESICAWSKVKGEDNSIRVSQTITSQVVRECVALLSNDLFETEGLRDKPSLFEARVCSVLCVPVVFLDKPLGVIYLDTTDSNARFEENELQLLTAIAAIVAAPMENARRIRRLENENQRLHEEIQVEHQMIGESVAMRSIYQFIGKVAPTDSTVLIRGESGTGKELAARAIHINSTRSAGAFVAINAATLSETLLESELFGHEKGAFTGAIAQKRGKLEIVDGGTLFLDEVGELTPTIQAKLLRVLQEREFERVGGSRPIKVDVRFIAATNKNLEEAVSAGTFRQDLYYRLNVLSLIMPPLRQRSDDIQLLATHFVRVYSTKCKRRINGISPEARSLLRSYDWPGNVRELENAIERAVVLGSVEMIVPEDLPESLFETRESAGASTVTYQEALKRAKSEIVVNAIQETNGNYIEAARKLGLHPNNLHRLIRNLNLKSKLKI